MDRTLLLAQDFRSCLFEIVCGSGHFGKTGRLAAEYDLRFPSGGVYISSDFLAVFLIIVRQHIGIRHANGFNTKYTCHLLFIGKVRIAKLFEPVEVVKGGMINAV